jgi:MYXO-CTERM domain-containing protein
MRSALLASVLLLVASAPAFAHFTLTSPASMTAQNGIGDPQKNEPCGPVGLTPAETGAITTVMTGGMLPITIHETVDHPGHYRVAIAQTTAGLPPPPTVTGANCGSAPIQANPTMPILADGLFQQATQASGPQTAMIQLPAGFTCTNCVVQVIQFMSAHPVPCFYYHCARVTISDTPAAPDAGPGAGPDAGAGGPDAGTGSGIGSVDGGCSTSGSGGLAGTALLAGLFALRRRRR